jgi:hypothetical protein
VRHARHMCTALKAWSTQDTLRSLLSSLNGIQHLTRPDVQDLSKIGAACFEWLRIRKLPRDVAFLPDGMGSIEALLRDAYRSFSGRVGDRAVEKSELAAAKAELAAFKASTSWRITEPLRQFVSLLR